MGDQLRLFTQERTKTTPWSPGYVNLRGLDAKELAQQYAIASKHNHKSYKKRVLAEARRRRISIKK